MKSVICLKKVQAFIFKIRSLKHFILIKGQYAEICELQQVIVVHKVLI